MVDPGRESPLPGDLALAASPGKPGLAQACWALDAADSPLSDDLVKALAAVARGNPEDEILRELELELQQAGISHQQLDTRKDDYYGAGFREETSLPAAQAGKRGSRVSSFDASSPSDQSVDTRAGST